MAGLFGSVDFDILNRDPVDLLNRGGDAAVAALLAGGGIRGGIEGAIGAILGPKPMPSFRTEVTGSPLTEFITSVQNSYGMARTNRYFVQMAIPITYSPNNTKILSTSDQYDLSMFCESVQLPGLNINTTHIRTFGEIREMPYEFNYDPIQLTFYIDGQMEIKDALDSWIKSIQFGENRNFNYYDTYICKQMRIFVQDLNDKPRQVIHIHEAFPKNISAVQMGYAQKDIMKVTLTLAFKNWVSELVVDDSPIILPTKTGKVTVGPVTEEK